jgi:hypothetical protein
LRRAIERHVGALLGLVLGGLALAPLLRGRGYALLYDMVFVPHAPLDRSLLGSSAAVPRAVPSDLLAAVLSHLLPGGLGQRLLLLAVFVLAASGGARLLSGQSLGARAVAAVVLAWNPYVAERLALGQWAVLLGYAALPWVVVAAARLRAGEWAWPALVLALGVAALTPSSAVVAGATGVLVLRRRRDLARLAAAWLVLDLPWLLPALLRPGGLPGTPEGVTAFAARADTPLGVLGSLLQLGGIWNADAVPDGRGAVGLVPVGLLLLAAAAWGVSLLLRGGVALLPRPVALGLLGAAALSLSVAVAGAGPGLRDALRVVVEQVPAAGLLRDGQRYLGPLAVLEAVALGLAAQELTVRLAGQPARRAFAVVAAAVPVLLLPGLANGVGGRLHPVQYPSSWQQARAVVDADPVPGALLALPWSAYRAPAWNDRRTVLDPATKAFGRRVVADDRLRVGRRVVPGEDPLAARLTPLVEGPGPLAAPAAAAGIRWVLVERDGPAAGAVEARLAGAQQVIDAPELSLWRVPRPAVVHEPAPPVGALIAGDVAALALLLGGLLGGLSGGASADRARRGERLP